MISTLNNRVRAARISLKCICGDANLVITDYRFSNAFKSDPLPGQFNKRMDEYLMITISWQSVFFSSSLLPFLVHRFVCNCVQQIPMGDGFECACTMHMHCTSVWTDTWSGIGKGKDENEHCYCMRDLIDVMLAQLCSPAYGIPL